MSQPVPAWKFWHPLPLWQLIVVFVVVHLVYTFAFVAVREGAGIDLPYWIASGLAGATAVGLVMLLARKKAAGQAR